MRSRCQIIWHIKKSAFAGMTNQSLFGKARFIPESGFRMDTKTVGPVLCQAAPVKPGEGSQPGAPRQDIL